MMSIDSKALNSESEVISALKAILAGEFDHSMELIDQKLDECALVLEKLNLMQVYDDDQNSLLHQAADYLTKIMVKEIDLFESAQRHKTETVEEEEAYELLWQAFDSCDCELLSHLVEKSVDLNVFRRDEPLIHLALREYQTSQDKKWLPFLGLLIKHGADVSEGDYDNCSFVFRVLETKDEDLLELIGLSHDAMAEFSQGYLPEEETEDFPIELFFADANLEKLAPFILDGVMQGKYGWQREKLIRIVTVTVGAIFEDTCSDEKLLSRLEYIYDELDVAMFYHFLQTHRHDPVFCQAQFADFYKQLDSQGRLNEDSPYLLAKVSELETLVKGLS